MSNNLKNIPTDDLLNRWNSLFDQYLLQAERLSNLLKDIDLTRRELLVIREELASRNIDVDETKDPGGLTQP